MRDDIEKTEIFIQMFLGFFVIILMTPCVKMIGCTQEQIKILFSVIIFLYMLLPFIFLGIERRLWEKIGSSLRQFLFVFNVIMVWICLLFLVVVFVLWLVRSILA
jgi:hypothetical protein